MKIGNGNGTTELGPGVNVCLDGGELSTAIDAYLVSHNIHVSGQRMITINGDLCDNATISVDPPGFVVYDGMKFGDLTVR